jgi:hypothetical protein
MLVEVPCRLVTKDHWLTSAKDPFATHYNYSYMQLMTCTISFFCTLFQIVSCFGFSRYKVFYNVSRHSEYLDAYQNLYT